MALALTGHLKLILWFQPQGAVQMFLVSPSGKPIPNFRYSMQQLYYSIYEEGIETFD